MRFSFLVFLSALLFLSCSTPTERAQKLYEAGEYQKVVDKYPNEPVTKQARLALADQLLQDGKYDEVLQNYGDIPSAAASAKAKLAERLLEDQKYDEILQKYPESPASIQAREHVAQQLYDDGKLDEVVEKFPNTAAGRTARNNMARDAYEAAMTKPTVEEKKRALEAIITDKRFAGTDVFPTIQEQYARLSGAK